MRIRWVLVVVLLCGRAGASGFLEDSAAATLRPEGRFYGDPSGELFTGVDVNGVSWTAHACFPDIAVGYYGWAAHSDLASHVTVDFAPSEPAEYFITPYQNDPKHYEIARHDCTNTVETVLSELFAGQGNALDLEEYRPTQMQAPVSPEGHPCAYFSGGLACFDPAVRPAAVTRYLTLPSLIAALVPGDRWKAEFPDISPDATVSARLSEALFVGPGHLFALATLVFTVQNTTWEVRYLVEQRPDGSVRARGGPEHNPAPLFPHLPRPDAISGVMQLRYDDVDRVVLGWPLTGMRFIRDSIFDASQGGAIDFFHFDGLGLAVVPVDGDGIGELDLSDVVATLPDGGATAPTPLTVVQQPPGRLRFQAAVDPDATFRVWRLLDLDLDLDRADFDRDGRDGAAERAQGGSDFLLEDAGPALHHGAAARYVHSPLLQARIPLQAVTPQDFPARLICLGDSCYDASGTRVLTLPNVSGLYLTPDGTQVVWDDGSAIRRETLADPQPEVLAQSADVHARSGQPGPLRLLPGRGGRVYVDDAPVPVVLGDGPPQVLFDLVATACALHIGVGCEAPATGFRPHAVLLDSRVAGYDLNTDRLLYRVETTEDSFLVALAPGAAPEVVARPLDFERAVFDADLQQFASAVEPVRFVNTADHDFVGTWTEGVQSFSDSHLRLSDAFADGSVAGTVSGGWGDSLFEQVGASDFGQLFEIVKEDAVVRPGDLLTFGAERASATPNVLYKSGPRGGALALATVAEVGAPAAMAASADGRLCAVDLADGHLVELSQPDANGVPAVHTRIATPHPAVDCQYDAAGTLRYLVASPPLLGTVTGGVAREEALGGVSKPWRFVFNARGQLRVADEGRPFACVDLASHVTTHAAAHAAAFTYGLDGRLYLLDSPKGQLHAVPDEQACTGALQDFPVKLGELRQARTGQDVPVLAANLAQRPDGWFVLQQRADLPGPPNSSVFPFPTYQFVWDPVSGRSAPATLLPTVAPALALVPGGAWCDAWAADLPDPSAVRCPSRHYDGGPASAAGSTSGTSGASGASGASGGSGGGGAGGCGCQPSGSSGGAALALPALLALLARRRRAHR